MFGLTLRTSAVLWLALVPLAVGCKRGLPAPEDRRPKAMILQRNVELTRVIGQPLVSRVETVGMLEAEGTTDIAAGVSGVIDDVHFREGDEVQPGTLLVTIDRERYESDEALAKANAERARANLELSRDLAERADRAGTGTSEEERVKARGLMRIADAEMRSQQAAWSRAKNNLDRSRVRAPYAGRINKRLVTKGSFLEEKTPIATIADLSRIRLVGYVPESAAKSVRELLRTQELRLGAARLGMALAMTGPGTTTPLVLTNAMVLARDYVPSGYDPEFEVLAVQGPSFLGRIFYMSTVANPDTHMFETKAEVLGWHFDPRPQGDKTPRLALSDPVLWPGFSARIRFPLRSQANACLVPEEAVRASERGFIAFVPFQQSREDGQSEWVARARILDLGFRADGWVEVRGGLKLGEPVVRRGAEALEDGTPIRFDRMPGG